MSDEEIAQIRAAAKEYARLQVVEAVERIERDDRVPVLQAVCDDRRLRVRDAANRRLWVLSTRGPVEVEELIGGEIDMGDGKARKLVRAGSRSGKTAKR